MTNALPRILFFNINGSGTGHLSRCLAYARCIQHRAKPVFFSLASAVEIINEMGFDADYFVSEFWSRSHINAWNRELAIRLGLMLEEVRPTAVVFDGTWPFHGFMDACDTYGVPVRVWSNRGLHKDDFDPVPVAETDFDLVLCPGEIGTEYAVERADRPGRKVTIPPVTLLMPRELLERDKARELLGLESEGRYALLSLGPGNLKDVSHIARGLIDELHGRGFVIAWARAPISVRDIRVADAVIPVSAYPLVRYMRAFDIFVGAAGYNTCYEVIQSGVPSLLIPNTMVADHQARRAEMMTQHSAAVVSACESAEERRQAIDRLLEVDFERTKDFAVELNGAERGAEEILAIVESLTA